MWYISHRWQLNRLHRKRKAIQEEFAEKEKALLKHGSSNPYAASELQADEYYENKNMDEWIDAFRSRYLIEQAIEYDVETPPVLDDSEFWQFTDDHENHYLNRKGRDLVQELINQAKERNSADWARRTKTFLPYITALAALIGALTGLVLALKR